MIDDRLLLASALVHARPGARLSAVDAEGRRLVVGGHPSADIDPCRWRAMLIAAIDGGGSSLPDGLRLDGLDGSLMPAAGAGVDDRNDPGRRWFAVGLPACLVIDVLRTADLGAVPNQAVHATVRPDPALGVTVVGVTVVGVGVDVGGHEPALDQVATAIAGAWAVAELCFGLSAAER
jgi:hypothetical protein